MSKKPKDGGGALGAAPSALKHNPFAALAGKAAELPVAPPKAGAEPSDPALPAPGLSSTAEAPAETPSAPKLRAPEGKAKTRGRLVLRRETKHRGGKAVIIVTGLGQCRDLDDAAIERLAKELKQSLGCGGTVERDGPDPRIVLQGDRPAKVAELLRALNFRVDGVTS